MVPFRPIRPSLSKLAAAVLKRWTHVCTSINRLVMFQRICPVHRLKQTKMNCYQMLKWNTRAMLPVDNSYRYGQCRGCQWTSWPIPVVHHDHMRYHGGGRCQSKQTNQTKQLGPLPENVMPLPTAPVLEHNKGISTRCWKTTWRWQRKAWYLRRRKECLVKIVEKRFWKRGQTNLAESKDFIKFCKHVFVHKKIIHHHTKIISLYYCQPLLL